MATASRVSGLPVDALITRLTDALNRETNAALDFVFVLAELKRRSVHLALGFDSLFTYCVDGLKLERSRAFRRSAAADLVERFPLAAELLHSGQLSISALLALNTVLAPDNHRDLLQRACGMTEEQARRFASELRPVPSSVDSIRLVHTLLPPPARVEVPTPRSCFGPKLTDAVPAPATAFADAPTLVPTETYRLNVTLSKDVHDQLVAVKDALAHKVPDGDLNAILAETFRLALAVIERRRLGAPTRSNASAAPAAFIDVRAGREETVDAGDALVSVRPCPGAPAGISAEASVADRSNDIEASEDDADFAANDGPDSRYIPADVRRAVWERDGGCCSFVGATGRRCGSTYRLEFDHWKAFALGGQGQPTTRRCCPTLPASGP